MAEEKYPTGQTERPVENSLVDNEVEQPQTTMFYDGGCPLCSREVAHYRRLDQQGRIKWADIHADPATVNTIRISYEEAMARLHVRDRSGEVQSGAWAFAAVWEELPYYRWLARVLRTLRLLPLVDLGYTYFARWRFRRRSCETGTCASR